MKFGEIVKKTVVGTKQLFQDTKEALAEQEAQAIEKKKETLKKLKEQNKKASEKAKLDAAIKKEREKLQQGKGLGDDLFNF